MVEKTTSGDQRQVSSEGTGFGEVAKKADGALPFVSRRSLHGARVA